MNKRIITTIIVSILLISNVNAEIFSTIGMTGLSFVNPTAATVVSNALCVLGPTGVVVCASQFVKGKIIGQVYGEALQEIAKISPEVAQSIITYNKIKGYIDSGDKIIEELELDENGNIKKGKIEFVDKGKNVGKLLGFENDEDAFTDKVNIEFFEVESLDKEGNIISQTHKKITFNEEGRFWIKTNKGKVAYENIKEGGFITVDGNVIAADITSSKDDSTYTFGENEPLKNIPKDIHIVYKGGVIEVLGAKGKSFNYGNNLIKMYGSYAEINKDKISCTLCDINDLSLYGTLFIKQDGYLLERGSVKRNGLDIYSNHASPIFISNTPDSNYDMSWVYVSNNLIQARSYYGDIILNFGKDSKLFDFEDNDLFTISLDGISSIEISKGDNKIPLIMHNHEIIDVNSLGETFNFGKTYFKNGNLDFIIDKGISMRSFDGKASTIPFRFSSNILPDGSILTFDSNNNFELNNENYVGGNFVFKYTKEDVINPIENHGKNAIVIIADPSADWNGAFRDIGEQIEKVRVAGYNVYVDTVSTKDEYFNAFKEGADSLGGKFDFYLGGAHGNPHGILLGEKEEPFEYHFENGKVFLSSRIVSNDLESFELENIDLSNYFNPGARGVQRSCSVTDTTICNNFAQALSNSLNIPIEGLLRPAHGEITDNLHLAGISVGEVKGFDPFTGIGIYKINFQDSLIFEDFKIDFEGKEVPPYFDPSKIYHINIRNDVAEVKPKK